jgi:ribosome-binding protein aMBF1 (putative translation factor)
VIFTGVDVPPELRREAQAYYMGQVIRDARKAEKVSQAELAERMGVV